VGAGVEVPAAHLEHEGRGGVERHGQGPEGVAAQLRQRPRLGCGAHRIDETPQPLGLAQHEAPVYEPPAAEIPLSWDDAKDAGS
jgi:hypothetical protein